MKTGDLPLKLDGTVIPTSRPEESDVFASLIRQYRIGTEADLTVGRSAEDLSLKVKLDASPEGTSELADHENETLEFNARDIGQDDRVSEKLPDDFKGVIITAITPAGWAALAGLSSGDLLVSIDGRMVNGPQGPIKLSAKSTTKEVKILMSDGSETPAKVAFKDPDLDLAFIRPEKADDVKFTPVDTPNSAPMALLDDVIILGRLGRDLNREPVVMTSEVISIISKPRTFGKVSSQTLGMPVFNKDGKFLGLGINRFGPKGDHEGQGRVPQNVILAAADLLESAAQAK
jgi:S1-C subfamily serine protease